MSGSIRLGKPNFAMKIFVKGNHDCLFVQTFLRLVGVIACEWVDKPMAVQTLLRLVGV